MDVELCSFVQIKLVFLLKCDEAAHDEASKYVSQVVWIEGF